ncbi:MAG TPA: hypothetical protein VIM11_26615 [Tepidisphaeraceae bacterium]
MTAQIIQFPIKFFEMEMRRKLIEMGMPEKFLHPVHKILDAKRRVAELRLLSPDA